MAVFDAIRWTTRGLISSTCRPTVIGLENVPKDGPFIVAPNHLSFLDSVIVQALMPRPVAFFAKAEYFTTKGVKGAVMKSFFEAVGSIPVERGEQAASVQALKTCWISSNRERASASTLRGPAPATGFSTVDALAWGGLP
jgi:1-acyl-sn-glycerol-3-phosphate acyltransferase